MSQMSQTSELIESGPGDRPINVAAMTEAMREALAGPEGKRRLRPSGSGTRPLGLVLMLAVAAALIATGLLSPLGFLILWKLWRRRRRNQAVARLQRKPERMQAVPAAGIIVGPAGHALSVAMLDAQPTVGAYREMTQFALRCGEIYGGLEEGPEDLTALLQDDGYQLGRRRPVPAEHTNGHRYVFCDVMLDEDGDAVLADVGEDALSGPAVLFALALSPPVSKPKAPTEPHFGANVVLPSEVLAAM